MSNVLTTIDIAATPARVWQTLTDFAAWAAWNPIIPRIRAEARVGGAVSFRIQIEGTLALPLTARVVRCDPERGFAWRGGAPVIPSLAWGEHFFRIEPAGASGDGVRLTHGEDFGGLLAVLMNGPAHARVTRSYDAMNRALKARAEA